MYSNTDQNRKYELKSELARLCLPEASRDAERKFGWMNSICALFLLIGIFGRPLTVSIGPVSSPAEVLPTMLEPVAQPPSAPMREATSAEESEPAKPDFAPVVVVSNLPSINISVPAIGDLVVPAAMAVAPEVVPVAKPVPKTVSHPETPVLATPQLNNTGTGGERPYPPYPPAALERRQQGTVVLTMEVDALGAITRIDIKASSGYAILDHSTLEFVQRNWKVPPGAGSRTFEAAVKYVLESE